MYLESGENFRPTQLISKPVARNTPISMITNGCLFSTRASKTSTVCPMTMSLGVITGRAPRRAATNQSMTLHDKVSPKEMSTPAIR